MLKHLSYNRGFMNIRISLKVLLKQLPILTLLALATVSYGQVKWLTFEEAEARIKVEPRKIFVDVMTEWCTWCKKMDVNTFEQEEIAKFLNEAYYPVRFDAEQKEEIFFNGKSYKYGKIGKRMYNELAIEMMKGLTEDKVEMGFPSIVFLDEEMNVLQSIQGYRGPKEFSKIASYFAGDFHKSVPWRSYSQSYNEQEELDYSRIIKNKQ